MSRYLLETLPDLGKGEDIKVISLDGKTDDEIIKLCSISGITFDELQDIYLEIKDEEPEMVQDEFEDGFQAGIRHALSHVNEHIEKYLEEGERNR